MIRKKHVPFTPGIAFLIALILPLTFIPYTFSLLAFLVPAYFSTLPAHVPHSTNQEPPSHDTLP